MMSKIPTNAEHYFTTKSFTALTTPLSLLHEHRIAEDVWGEIVVEAGEVLYETLDESGVKERLTPQHSGIVAPGMPHRVTPRADARFRLELYRTSRRNARQ